MTHTAKKIAAGNYEYRGYTITHETEAQDPEGNIRPYWSIGDKGAGFAIAENPHLKSLKACKDWIDYHITGQTGWRDLVAKDNWAAGYGEG
ncbi:hypothetical protein RPALISO_157 [Ruegeria phage RpAliso]|nr:hypothetical protein RPALISO_157 [Ruegeria phage RpAliso]